MTGAPIDVAIVGAGIAGCAAAVSLRGSGRSVAVVGPTTTSSERIGEFLSPAANALLRELGLTDAFSAGPHRLANASYSAWGSDLLVERNAIVHTDGPGYVLDRAAFEHMLTRAASLSGATMLADSVTGAQRDNGVWTLPLSGGNRLIARFVLDCSGRAAVVARLLATRRRVDRLVAAYGFLRQHDDSVEPTPATLIEAVPGGWWYASLLRDQRLALALFADPDTLPRGVSRDRDVWRGCVSATRSVQRWLDSAGYAIEAPARLASAATTWLEPVGGPGWAAAGDAAAAFDPLSSHGLATALWSGRHAALAATAELSGDAAPLARYVETLGHAVQGFLRQRRGVYAREQRWREERFWQRRVG